MSEIICRIRREIARHFQSTSDRPVIYVGRAEFYDLLLMKGWTPLDIRYVNDVRRVTFDGLELIEVCNPKYLRVA